jgi:uracil-DNA glycosylase family 4
MELKRFKCSDRSSCTFEQSCTRLPVEIHGDAPIDILFVTEFPGKSEAEEETPFVGKFMSSARACVQHLSKKYGFTYAFTSLHKSRKTRFGDAKRPFSSMEIASCAKCVFEREVEHLQPRIIMGFGEMAEEYLGDHKVESIFVESGCIRTSRKIKGRTYDYITSVHPSWCVGQLDPNALGIVYDDIETAALYVKKGVDLRIPDIFESVLLKTIEDVKRVLIELKSKATYIAVDTEDCNLHRVYNNRMLSVQLCADGHTGYVIPLLHYDSPFVGKDVERVIKMLKTFFTTKKTKCKGYVFVNAKYDYHQFFREFHIFQFNAPIIDCSYNEYCLEENLARIAQTKVFPNRQGPYSLYTMSYKRGFTYYKTTGSKERRDILEKIPLSEWEGYAGADAVATFNIWKSQLKRAKALGVLSDFKKEAITLFNHKVRSIVYTEHCGMATDTNVLRDLYNPRTSVLLRAMDDIVREMNAMPSVQALNKRMQKSSIGFSGSFLGTVNAFQPTKRIQLEMLFFDILGLEPLGDKLSVDKAFQEEYKKSVPEVAKLAEYNEIATLQKMFVKPIYEMMTPGTALSSPDFYVDNRIRPTFRTDAVTSRLRCEKPNLQQRPARGSRIAPILSMYNCKPGRAIVKLDFSTFEVRGLGFISQDDNMVKLFREMHRIKEDFRKDPYVYAEEGYTSKKERLTTSLKALKKNKSAYKLLDGDQKKEALSKLEEEISGLEKELEQLEYDYKHNPIKLSMEVRKWKTDFHRRSAALFNNISIEEVSPSQRQGAKGFVFGSMYGRGEQSIANELGISLEEATAIKAKFQANMPDATGWLEASADYASKHLCVKSPLGTIRHLWGYLRGEKGITSKMDRLAQNSIIQGMCSNMTLVGISHLLDFIFECKKAKYQTSDDEAWFTTNIVHDSAEMEIPIEDVFFVCLNFEEYFTSKLEAAILEEFGFEIKLPLEVDFTVGSTYANTKDWDGSKLHLKKLQKWVIEECGKRDGVDYSHLYKKAIRKKLSDFIGDDEAA